jgi:hypothetical protein
MTAGFMMRIPDSGHWLENKPRAGLARQTGESALKKRRLGAARPVH